MTIAFLSAGCQRTPSGAPAELPQADASPVTKPISPPSLPSQNPQPSVSAARPLPSGVAQVGDPHHVGISECDVYQAEIACFWSRGGVDKAFIDKSAIDRANAWKGRASMPNQREAVLRDCISGRRGMRGEFEKASCAR